MKKNALLIIAVLVFPFLSFSQFTFEKTLGTIDNDRGYSVDQCNDNGYFVVGSSENYYFEYLDIYVIKTDVAGDILWTDTIGDPQINEWPVAGIQTFDGGYVVCGHKVKNGFTVPILVRYNSSGEKVWSKTFPNQGHITPSAIIQVPDSSFVIVGDADHDTTSKYWSKFPFIMKITSTGELEWFHDIFIDFGFHYCHNVELAHGGGFIVCGKHRLLGNTRGDGFIIKLTSNGDSVLWTVVVGDENLDEIFRSVKRTDDQGYILCGTKWLNTIPYDTEANVFLVKINHLGHVLWEKQINRVGLEYGYDHDIAHDEGLVITGIVYNSTFDNDSLLLIKTDAYGDTLWTKTFGGNYRDQGISVQATTDDGYITCGLTNSYGAGGSDIYLIKTDDIGIVTAINDHELVNSTVNCYPNPCSRYLNIEADFRICTISIMDISGYELCSRKVNQKNLYLDLEEFNIRAGLVYILVKGQRQSIVKKVIINN